MEQYRRILKDYGLQITRQRLLVLKTLKELNCHVTVDQVCGALKERNIVLTVATVYNILNLFEKSGIIMRLSAAGEPVIFDVNTHEHAHVCDLSSREVVDYNDKELFQMIKEYILAHPPKDFEIERIDINLIAVPKADGETA